MQKSENKGKGWKSAVNLKLAAIVLALGLSVASGQAAFGDSCMPGVFVPYSQAIASSCTLNDYTHSGLTYTFSNLNVSVTPGFDLSPLTVDFTPSGLTFDTNWSLPANSTIQVNFSYTDTSNSPVLTGGQMGFDLSSSAGSNTWSQFLSLYFDGQSTPSLDESNSGINRPANNVDEIGQYILGPSSSMSVLGGFALTTGSTGSANVGQFFSSVGIPAPTPPSSVPEPPTFLLLGIGLAVMAAFGVKKFRTA